MVTPLVRKSKYTFSSEIRKNVLARMFIQSTLVISKSNGPAETLRDIRTSTNRMCRIEENTERTTKFHNEHVI